MNKLSKKFQNKVLLSVNLIICVVMTLIMIFYFKRVALPIKILIYICITSSTVLGVLFFILKKDSLLKSVFLFSVVTFVFTLIFFFLNRFGSIESFRDLEKIKRMILSWGTYGYIAYVLLQLFQVIILPAPGFLFYLAGTAIYGPLTAFLLSYASVTLGSVVAFYIGRFFGKPIVNWCVGKEKTDKYVNLLGSKGNVLFVLMQILPFFPDDILCMIAGLTKMKFPFFLIVMLITRPIYIATVCFLGTGEIIPFSGWGIAVWIGIFLLLFVTFLLYCKYQTKLENLFTSSSNK